MAIPRFLFAELHAATEQVTVTGNELHHLHVLRLRPGDPVLLFDGAGIEAEGILDSLGQSSAAVRVLRIRHPPADPGLRIVLAMAAVKPNLLDMLVQKATELGAQRLLLFDSSRTQQRRLESRLVRWRRIATEAAKQCGRSGILEVAGPVSFAEVLTQPAELRLVIWEAASETENLDRVHRGLSKCSSICLVIGPEGGFTETEISDAIRAGFQTTGLGPRIMRAETAAIAALSIVQYLWGDMCGGSEREPCTLAPGLSPP